MIAAAFALLTLFVFPMWRITLIAPQYPNGVTMYIWINQLSGDSPGTLQNINILNHYVGMKYIEPESIPELKYFPYVVIAMTLLGLVAAAVNRRNGFLAWAVLMAILAAIGIYDFYLWEYDYGHNLSPNAPIKIPGIYKATDISLKRGVLGALDLVEWLNQVRSGADARRDITIQLQTEDLSAIAMTWKLIGAQPMKYTGPSLNGKGTDVAIEELGLSVEDIQFE